MDDKIINLEENVFFYDDRSKYDDMLKLSEILYQNKDICLCNAKWIIEEQITEPVLILFNTQTRQVLMSDYYSWYATNNKAWVEENIEAWRKRLDERESELGNAN